MLSTNYIRMRRKIEILKKVFSKTKKGTMVNTPAIYTLLVRCYKMR